MRFRRLTENVKSGEEMNRKEKRERQEQLRKETAKTDKGERQVRVGEKLQE